MPMIPISVQASAPFPIVQWFAYLDQVEEHNKDGITFAQYGQILNLQELLKIPLGMAALIIQYAKHDLEDLQAGHWMFPQSDLE
ncbi:hypothetical protein JVU11DRAFT_2027 [Chiua virens]|nr:hypothetical protein JVU11DRAFT_2027 [Chiua virens]